MNGVRNAARRSAFRGCSPGGPMPSGKYGTKSLAETAARAIQIAENGFPVGATFSAINKDEFEKLLKNAGETTCYLNSGIPYEPGDIFKNPDLARTLKTIVAKGIGEFYRGDRLEARRRGPRS